MSGIDVLATRDDVIACYRTVLSRDPEGEAVVDQILLGKPRLWDLILAALRCEESVVRQITPVGNYISALRYTNVIELDGTPEQLDSLFSHVRQVWSSFGEAEPYWSVLSDAAFRTSAMDDKARDLFYRSGRASCDIFAMGCMRNEVVLPTDGVVVDFGCGVGRLGVHLSQDFARYVGVDISPAHLKLAEDEVTRLGRTNCTFALLPDFLESSTTYDAFVSLIVLQHNPPPVIDQLINNLLSRLNPGGVGFFQIPCFLFGYEFRLIKYLETMAENKAMEMHALPQHRVFSAIAANGCRLVEVTMDGMIGSIGLSYTFLVVKL